METISYVFKCRLCWEFVEQDNRSTPNKSTDSLCGSPMAICKVNVPASGKNKNKLEKYETSFEEPDPHDCWSRSRNAMEIRFLLRLLIML
jgi:hypothetical protein